MVSVKSAIMFSSCCMIVVAKLPQHAFPVVTLRFDRVLKIVEVLEGLTGEAFCV